MVICKEYSIINIISSIILLLVYLHVGQADSRDILCSIFLYMMSITDQKDCFQEQFVQWQTKVDGCTYHSLETLFVTTKENFISCLRVILPHFSDLKVCLGLWSICRSRPLSSFIVCADGGMFADRICSKLFAAM